MDKQDLDKIIKKVEKERESLAFESLDTLSQELPSEIIGREKETEEIVRYLLGYKSGHVVPLVSIYGRSGTGKSTLARFVCSNLKGVKMCHANLRKAKTVFGGANIILNSLGLPSLKSAQGLNTAVEMIKDGIISSIQEKKLFVLILDEFDVLFYDMRTSPSDFVYKLLEIQAELKSSGVYFCIITVSNNVLAEYDLDDRVRSRIGNSEIFFAPYTKERVKEILGKRIPKTLQVSDEVIDYCAELSYMEHGDARRAVDLLRVAMELALKSGKKISKEHVDAASERIQKDRTNEVIRTLSYHSRATLFAVASRTFGLERPWHSTNEIYASYQRRISGKPVSYRRFSELLKDLENTGLLESHTSSKGQKGYSSEFKLVAEPEMVARLIDSKLWEEMKKKKSPRPLQTMSITKNSPYYNTYQMLKKLDQNYW